jgi:PAS domain S-box-containing protein
MERSASRDNNFSRKFRVLWGGVILASVYWIIESVFHVYVFNEGTLSGQLFYPSKHELWMRSVIVSTILFFSFYAQRSVNLQRKSREATSLAHSELNQIFNTAADGMRIVDKDFNVLRINDTFSSMTGVSKEEAKNKKCYEIFRGEVCQTPDCPLTRILAGEERVEVDAVKETRDGKQISCIVTATPYRDMYGNVVGIVENFKDITERKTAEIALKESEEKYRLVVENANEGIVIVQDAKFCFVNDKAAETAGYSREELLGTSIEKLIHHDDIEVVINRHYERLKGVKLPGKYSFRITNRNGEVRWVETNAVLINWEGKPAVLNFVTDVTERKKAEEKIEAALREKEALLKEIHHRVKNNLQIISSLINLQTRFISDDKIISALKDSQNRIKSMALVHEKLYGSDSLTRINFMEYLQSLISHLLHSYESISRKIRLKVDVDNIEMNIDTAIPCSLIINELISNSLQHAFPDGKEGELIVGLKESHNGKLKLTVSDNGIGFPENLDLDTTETLGLQLVVSLTKQLNGEIQLYKEGGTKFEILFSPESGR